MIAGSHAAQQKMLMNYPAYTYSVLLAIGGSMGYIKKGSVPSLVAGLSFSALYGYAGYLLQQHKKGGIELALVASVLLLLAGLARGIPVRFGKPVPIVLTVLGAVGSYFYGAEYLE